MPKLHDTTPSDASRLSLSLPHHSSLNSLARKTGFLNRSGSKFSPRQLLLALVVCICRREYSLREIASQIGVQAGCLLSKAGLHKRLAAQAEDFVREATCEAMRNTINAAGAPTSIPGVKRVLVGDSTVLRLHDSLASDHPGAGEGRSGWKGAGLRVQATFDLLGGRPVEIDPAPYRHNDRAAACEVLRVLRPEDLVLRDLGYWSSKAFDEILSQGAHILSRLNMSAKLYAPGGEELDAVALARQTAPRPGDVGCRNDVVVGKAGRLALRLVVCAVPGEIADRRRRRLRADAKRRGKTPTARALELCAWTFLVTDLGPDALSAADALALYRARWRIENLFRLAKSNVGLRALSAHRTNRHHLGCMFWAWVLTMVLAGWMGALAVPEHSLARGAPLPLSMVKTLPTVLRVITQHIELCAAGSPAELSARLFRQLEYHGRYEKRRRIPLPVWTAKLLDPDA